MSNVSDILARRRQEAVQKRDRRVEALYAQYPDMARIHRERLQQGRVLLGKILSMNEEQRKEAEADLRRRREEEQAGWKALGIPAEVFLPDYVCSDCHDEGFVNGVSCHCRNRLLAEARYDMSAIGKRVEVENFQTFNLQLFRQDRQSDEPCSPFENMADLRRRMKEEYIPTFSRRSPNLYFYGPTGTGKTFFLNCIVKELLDRGVQVYYQTAPQLLEFLTTYSFSYAGERTESDRVKHDFAFSCDLLVIDDLGTEFLTDKMRAELFELLNGRIVAALPTIISSNVQLEELGDLYGERIASRIAGEYIPFALFGSDLRRQ